MREYRWMPFNDGAESLYSFVDTKPNPVETMVDGWVSSKDDGTWLARTNDALVRETFPTKEEAKEFLWAICNMRGGQ